LVLGDAYRNILVAYDGSEGGRAALRRAAELAAQGRALTVVRATSDEGAAVARDSLEGAVGGLEASLEVRPWAVPEPAGRAILALASDIDADLIVAGSRARGRFAAAAALGSVSTELAHHASCDVLVIPPYME
jgi:nucleotide-binding universal stress UspA family protein